MPKPVSSRRTCRDGVSRSCSSPAPERTHGPAPLDCYTREQDVPALIFDATPNNRPQDPQGGHGKRGRTRGRVSRRMAQISGRKYREPANLNYGSEPSRTGLTNPRLLLMGSSSKKGHRRWCRRWSRETFPPAPAIFAVGATEKPNRCAAVMPGADWNSKSRWEGSIPSGGANFGRQGGTGGGTQKPRRGRTTGWLRYPSLDSKLRLKQSASTKKFMGAW